MRLVQILIRWLQGRWAGPSPFLAPPLVTVLSFQTPLNSPEWSESNSTHFPTLALGKIKALQVSQRQDFDWTDKGGHYPHLPNTHPPKQKQNQASTVHSRDCGVSEGEGGLEQVLITG